MVLVSVAALFCQLIFLPIMAAQDMDESIVSKHLRLSISAERKWLGRDSIGDLERCWEFVRASAGGQLPSRVLVVIEWQDAAASIAPERSSISIGMNDPAAAKDPRGFLLQGAARGFARLSLTNLLGDAGSQPENRFLVDGMSEIIAHEFSDSARRLGAAWVICHYLDLIKPLGMRQLAGRPGFSGENHDFIASAPGITLLTLCSELYGRDHLMKLFEYLENRSLEESISAAFKTRAAALEMRWLSRVRAYDPKEITISADEEAPALDRILFVPEQAKPGATIVARAFTKHGKNDLVSAGIFLFDEASGKVLQGRSAKAAEGVCTQFEIPIDSTQQEGRYRVRIVAVDNGGNVRIWESFYAVAR